MTNRKRLCRLGLLLLGVLALGCSMNPVTGKKEPALISEQEEIAMGVSAAPEFEKEFEGLVDNAELQAYIQAVGGKLAAVSDRPMPYEYALLKSDVANAFALPGGKIYVTVGLFKHMTNEQQLAAVLGHETVHVAAKHSVNALQREMGAAILAELAEAAAGGEVGAGAKIATGMYNLSYGRKDESLSDAVGVRYMAEAGYNPWGMVELLEILQSLDQSEPGLFGDFFRSHPLTSERIKDVREIVARDYGSYSAATADPRAEQFLKMRKLLPSAVK